MIVVLAVDKAPSFDEVVLMIVGKEEKKRTRRNLKRQVENARLDIIKVEGLTGPSVGSIRHKDVTWTVGPDGKPQTLALSNRSPEAGMSGTNGRLACAVIRGARD